jgi:hypothetical protein
VKWTSPVQNPIEKDVITELDGRLSSGYSLDWEAKLMETQLTHGLPNTAEEMVSPA